MAEKETSKLGLYIAVCCGIICVIWTLILITTPSIAGTILNKLYVKVILFYIGLILTGFFGFSLYRYFKLPSLKRLVIRLIYIFTFLLFTSSIAPIGLSGLEQVLLKSGESLFEVKMGSGASMSLLAFGICAFGILILCGYYLLIPIIESKYGHTSSS